MDTLALILQTTSLLAIVALICWVAILWIQIALECVADWLTARRRRRIARIEAELDAKADALRRTILALAEQLAAERDAVSARMASAAAIPFGSAVANSTTREIGASDDTR